MRTLALLAAITLAHMVHASPRPDLAVRPDADDLSNDRHVFHHLDRNQRTANRDHERVNGEGWWGGYFVKKLEDEQHGGARARVVDRRFMQGPDYSQGGGTEGGSESTNTTYTQQPGKPGETANSHT